jgi:Malic enzyme, N-terminal domain
LAPLCRPDALVDEFVEAANQVFPGVCVHFEDWKGSDAIRLLARYKDISLTTASLSEFISAPLAGRVFL